MFSRAGYDSDNWLLLLEFKSTGEIRAYKDVAPETADQALGSKSLGSWWNQNVRNVPAWEYEIIVPAEPERPKEHAPSVTASGAGFITVDDIQAVDATYGIHESAMGLEPTTWPTYGGIARGDFGVTEFDPATGHRPNSEVDDDGSVKMQILEADSGAGGIASIPQPTVMPAWTAPENAAEALDLLYERESEIDAIIAQAKQVGADALTVKVKDADGRVKASDLLNDLVDRKDKVVELLDPFRKTLHEAYKYAGERVAAAKDPLESAVKHIKAQCISWDNEQARLRAEEQRKAREAAEAEARRRQEEERQRITLQEVQDKLDAGETAAAQSLFENPVDVPLPYVQPQYVPSVAPVIDGQSVSQKWKVDETLIDTDEKRLESIMTLLRAVKEGKYDMRTAAVQLDWNLPSLNKLAAALKQSFFVPGLAAVPVSTMAVRRKK